MNALKIEHSKKLNYYVKGESTFINVSIFNKPNNEYDLIENATEKLSIITLDPYYADLKKEIIDGKFSFTIYFKNKGTARFKIIYEYTDILGRPAKEIEIIQFVCYEKFYSENYKFLIAEYDYNLMKNNPKFKVIMENIFDMFDILEAYASDVESINSPLMVKSKYLETLGRDIGFERIDIEDVDTHLEEISNNLYRELLLVIGQIVKLKGTPLSYQLFFNALGYDIVINEYWWNDINQLVEIDTSKPINQSSFDLYSKEGIFLGKKSPYDPRSKISANNSRVNAKSNYISVTLSAMVNNLGVPVDYAPDIQTLSANKRRILKEYLSYLRPQHIEYLNDIIKFSLEFDGNNYELIEFWDLITENLTVQQLLQVGTGAPPLIKRYPYFDLIDLEDELFLVDWTEFYQLNNERSFDIFFNLPVQKASCENFNNYRILVDNVDISNTISSIQQVAANRVRITFANDLVPGVYQIFHTGIFSIYGGVFETPANIIENPLSLKFRLLQLEIDKYVEYGSLPASVPFNLVKVKALQNSKIEVTFNNDALPFYPIYDKLKNRVTLPTTTSLSNFEILNNNTNLPLSLYQCQIDFTNPNKLIFDVSPMDNLVDYTFVIKDANYIHTNNLNNFFAGPMNYVFKGIAPGYNEDGIALPPEGPVPTWQEFLQNLDEDFSSNKVASIEDGEDIIAEPVKWNQVGLNWGDFDLYWGKRYFFDDLNEIKKKINPTNISNPYEAIDIDSGYLTEIAGVGVFSIDHILKNGLLSLINEPLNKDRTLYYEVSTKKINTLRVW